MSTIDERVAYLEGKMEEHSRGFGELRNSIHRLETRFDTLDQKLDRRFEAVEARFGKIEDRMSRQFVWTVGVQSAVLIAILGTFAAR